MIHTVGGDTYPVPYGEKDQCIYSVGRRYVNEILLTGIYYVYYVKQFDYFFFLMVICKGYLLITS